ncbi:MAG: hypothetical protein ACOZNI_00760 [Myxococcota bacterium]
MEIRDEWVAPYLDEDGSLSEEGCARLCADFAGLHDITRCAFTPVGTDTADTGEVAGVLDCDGSRTAVCEGRRPPGLVPIRVRTRTPFARWTRRAAWLEEASIHAFVRLSRELVAQRAPADLGRRALAAARDEVHHARGMRALAGGRGPRVRIRRLPPRDLEALALDNAVEGCVHETWGAAVAWWQAAHAPPALRPLFARIAADETLHAQLAWDIDAWVEARGIDTRVQRRRAGARLHGRNAAGPSLVAGLGLPPAEDAERLIARLNRSLWS